MHRGNKEREKRTIMENWSRIKLMYRNLINTHGPPQLIFKQVFWTEILVTIRYAMLLRFHINIYEL